MSNIFQTLKQALNSFKDFNQPVDAVARFLIRSSAFLRKEIVEVLRQPLLVLTLVLGPFLILLFFGIGYRNEPRALRTLFVVDQKDSALAQRIEQDAPSFGKQLIFAGITNNLEAAKEQLRRQEVDLITVVPTNAYNTILNNRQAAFQLYHHEIDPFQVDYVNVFSRVYIDALNRRVLRYITTEGQTNIAQARTRLEAAQISAAALRELLERCAAALGQPEAEERCDSETARQYLQQLDRNIDELELSAGDSILLIDGIKQELGYNDEPAAADQPTLADIMRNTNELSDLEIEALELEALEERANNYLAKLRTLTKLEHDLSQIDARLREFLDIDPRVLITPFSSEAQSIATIKTGITDFFAPSVIVLLLQHLTVTFAALSIVRERRLGSMELFNVSPLSALETLLGKYISYILFGGVLATILLALTMFGMRVPLLGSAWGVALVIAALLFTSLGIGFVISLLSSTDIQAVQYSMIVLLTSVFFSGFILGLDTLWQPVRTISWAIPATYGILLLRDIMLRGSALAPDLLLQLTAIGAALFLAAWFLLRRSMMNIS